MLRVPLPLAALLTALVVGYFDSMIWWNREVSAESASYTIPAQQLPSVTSTTLRPTITPSIPSPTPVPTATATPTNTQFVPSSFDWARATGRGLLTLIGLLVWPVVTYIALRQFHKPLAAFLKGISRRVTKVSVLQVAFELEPLREFKPEWVVTEGDIRKLTPAPEFPSDLSALLGQLDPQQTQYDYAVIDLGAGREWLTSRLFIFALMLERMRGLRAFVFLATDDIMHRHYLGTASPSVVRWKLVQKYQWLEAAYAVAYSTKFGTLNQDIYNSILSKPQAPKPSAIVKSYREQLRHPKLPDNLNPYTQILSAHGALNPIDAGDVAIMFLKQIQQHDRPADEREWVTLGSPPLWEHAIWIDAPLLKGILGDVLDATNTSIAFKKAPLDISRTRRAKTVLRRSGHVVALLDQDRVFKDLVDRQALLERVATVAGEITDGV